MIKTTYTARAYTCPGVYPFPDAAFPNADIPAMISNVKAHKPVVVKTADGKYAILPPGSIDFIKWTVTYGTEEAPVDAICPAETEEPTEP